VKRRGKALAEAGTSSNSTSNRLEQDGVVENSAAVFCGVLNTANMIFKSVRGNVNYIEKAAS